MARGEDRAQDVRRLTGLLEVGRLAREDGDLGAFLPAAARVVGESLGWGLVTMNVHRPAFDDFEVQAVWGDDEALPSLLGARTSWDEWLPFFETRFRRGECWFVPVGEFDWGEEQCRYTPPLPEAHGEDAWHPGDELLAPMRAADGRIVGIVSVDAPGDGRRPDDADLLLLAALAAHVARAIESAEEAASGARHRAALEHLLRVSTRLADGGSAEAVLDDVCLGVHEALGFERVAVELPGEDGAFATAAQVGWPTGQAPPSLLRGGQIEALCDPAFAQAGCYLLHREQALERIGRDAPAWGTHRSGRGPLAWDRHWLLVPLRDREGRLTGVLWADDPVDCLLPGVDRLQALALFADQAVAALRATARAAELRHLADHDALTGLPNRRAFEHALEVAAARAAAGGAGFAVLMGDLDRFKPLNDQRGHGTGDEALRQVAAALLTVTRGDGDAAFRVGGDEFAVLLGSSDELTAHAVARRIATAVAALPSPLDGLGISLGAALVAPGTAPDLQALVGAADASMYQAKRRGLVLQVAA